MTPDLAKVKAAVERLEARRKSSPDWRSYPPRPSPVAADAAIRKPLKAHGILCRGFGHHHFHQNDT